MTHPAGVREGPLLQRVRDLLTRAEMMCQGFGATEAEAKIKIARLRLDEPLRVAIVGRVKAGKSTLLNALVGEFVAATDAAECTRVVTWYDRGSAYRAFKLLRDGTALPAPFVRSERAASIDVGATPLNDIVRLAVEFPSPSLTDLTLIDTPGIASLTAEASARTAALLDDQDRQRVDAIIYLMRNLHQDDFRVLESFIDQSVQPVGPINSVAVLSRADEIGSGRTDALDQARRLAEQWRRHPLLRPMALTVLPVAALLAESAVTLTQSEFEAFRYLAQAPVEFVNHLLRSVDDFTHAGASPAIAVSATARRALVDRYGLYGLRIAIELIRHGKVSSADELAQALFRCSGVGTLWLVVLQQFAARRDVIKAANALDDLDELIDAVPQLALLERDIEQIRANAVDLDELRVLTRLRVDPDPEIKEEDLEQLERLLGVEGRDLSSRLGLGAHARPDEVRARALAELDQWRAVHSDLSQPPLLRRSAETIERLLARGLLQLESSSVAP